MDKRKQMVAKGLLAGVFILFAGCATQADLVDVQMDLEKVQAEQAHLKQLLEGTDRPKGLLESTQKSQGELAVRMDQLATDLQSLQGKLEEDRHSLSQLMQKIDEQTNRTSQMDSRLQVLESRLVPSSESSPATQDTGREHKPSGSQEEKKMIIPGRPPLSSLTPVEVYNLAYNDYLKGNYDLAAAGFQSFLKQFPDSTMTPLALYWLGECYYSKRDFSNAIESFDRVFKDFPKSEKVPPALLKEAYSYLEVGDKAKAKGTLKKVIEEYPLSNEASLAKNKLAEIR